MARALRIEFPGAWYHVTARGNERRAIFRSDADRQRLLDVLSECCTRFGLRLHGYALMPNHYVVAFGVTSFDSTFDWGSWGFFPLAGSRTLRLTLKELGQLAGGAPFRHPHRRDGGSFGVTSFYSTFGRPASAIS